jgi:hypothetical protein
VPGPKGRVPWDWEAHLHLWGTLFLKFGI